MIRARDLALLGRLYPVQPTQAPPYVLTGGSAVLCWLYDAPDCRRHRDIDLLVLQPEQFPLPGGGGSAPYLVGRLTDQGITTDRGHPVVEVQTVRGCYYDAEIVPGEADVRFCRVEETLLPVLSPEFLMASKLTFPNVHAWFDLDDAFSLHRHGCVQELEYLNVLLEQTSLNRLIQANGVLGCRSEQEFTAFLNRIHYLLVRRFLDWELAHIEVLNVRQCFVLLDIVDDLLGLLPEVIRLVRSAVGDLALDQSTRQLAMLCCCFLALELPYDILVEILHGPDFQKLLFRQLARHPDRSLSCLKRLSMILKTTREVEKLTGRKLDAIWQPATMSKIICCVLGDCWTFMRLASVRAIHEGLKNNHISVQSGMSRLDSMWGVETA